MPSHILNGLLYAHCQEANHEGFPTFRRSVPEQALQVLLTSALGDTFYVRSEVISGDILRVLNQAVEEEPELFARTLVYAREAGCMRLLPTLGTLVLSTRSPHLFARVFPRVVTTPRELRDFLLMCRKASLRQGLGRSLKRAVGAFLMNLSEYHLIKYGRAGGAFSLRDALRVARPKPETERQALMLRLVAKGVRSVPLEELQANLPQVACWRLFVETEEPTRRLELIEEGRLPYEAALGVFSPDRGGWQVLARQMPLLALLRHLATLARRGVLDDWTTLDYLCNRLCDPQAVRSSLPFRFHSAWHALRERAPFRSRPEAEPPWRPTAPGYVRSQVFECLGRALQGALQASLDSLPALEGEVCLAVDVSGSMDSPLLAQPRQGRRPSSSAFFVLAGRGSSCCGPRLVDVAALFAAGLMHSLGSRATVLPFNHGVLPFPLRPGERVFDTIDRLAALCSGGTALSAPVDLLLQRGKRVDHFIGITDSEEWSGRGFLPTWREYRRRLNPNAQAYLLTLAPYCHAVTPESEPGVHYFYGWSEDLVRHLALGASGGTQIRAVLDWTSNLEVS